jgi:hypothetical protein
MNITIRDLNESLFRKFKSTAVEDGIKLGAALNQAMHLWIEKNQNKPKGKLGDIKTSDWGKGSENASADIDYVLYGDNR